MNKIITTFALLVLTIATANAQSPASAKVDSTLKTGFTNIEYLLGKIPQVAKINEFLEGEKKKYEVVYEQKLKDLQNKFESYQKSAATMPEIIRKDKEKEIETQRNSIQEFQGEIEKDLSTKQNILIQPLYSRIFEAIQLVAEESKYQFIFNSGDASAVRHLLVAPANGDVSDLVLKKFAELSAKAEVDGQLRAKEAAATKPATASKANSATKETKPTKPAANKTPAKPAAKKPAAKKK